MGVRLVNPIGEQYLVQVVDEDDSWMVAKVSYADARTCIIDI
jgi:hypothetical protein